jgi:hypothetical protein
MKDGICPKCSSRTVYATNSHDENFMLPKNEKETWAGKYVNSEIIPSERYVCVNCGYFERYVADREFLEQITKSASWIKV